MHILFLIISSAFCILIYISEKKIYSPLFVYCAFWTILLFLSSLHLNIYSVDVGIYYMFWGGLLAFVIGYLFIQVFSRKLTIKSIHFSKKVSTSYSYRINYSIVVVLLLIAFAFLLVRAISAIYMLRNGYSIAMIRDFFYEYEAENQSSRYLFYFQNFIITPIIYSSSVIMVLDLLMGKKKKYLVLLTIIVTIFFLLVSGGGRIVLVNYFFHF